MALDIDILWYRIFQFRNVWNGFLKIFISCKQYLVCKIYTSVVRKSNRGFDLCLKWHSMYQMCTNSEVTGFVGHTCSLFDTCIASVVPVYCLCHVASCCVWSFGLILALPEAVTQSLALNRILKIPFTRTLLHGLTPNMTENCLLIVRTNNLV